MNYQDHYYMTCGKSVHVEINDDNLNTEGWLLRPVCYDYRLDSIRVKYMPGEIEVVFKKDSESPPSHIYATIYDNDSVSEKLIVDP